jgi:hypothetical protein
MDLHCPQVKKTADKFSFVFGIKSTIMYKKAYNLSGYMSKVQS